MEKSANIQKSLQILKSENGNSLLSFTQVTVICISALKQEMAPGENKRTDGSSDCLQGNRKCVAVHWYRHGLRLHDNPSLLAALEGANSFYPIFIFDGEVAGK